MLWKRGNELSNSFLLQKNKSFWINLIHGNEAHLVFCDESTNNRATENVIEWGPKGDVGTDWRLLYEI